MRFFLLFICLIFSFSCSRLPHIEPLPLPSAGSGIGEKCHRIFPKGSWQLVHSIEAVIPTKGKVFLTGVSIVSDTPPTLRCILMTLEGFVLFDGFYDRSLTIHRAVPPFDKPGFAEGLIDDVKLLLMEPDFSRADYGKNGDHASLCRFKDPEGGTTDIVLQGEGRMNILKYDSKERLIKTVDVLCDTKPESTHGRCWPDSYTLTRHGILGYSLKMKLINAIQENRQGSDKDNRS